MGMITVSSLAPVGCNTGLGRCEWAKAGSAGGDRNIDSKLPELYSRLGFGSVKQDCIPVNSKIIGWDNCWSVLGPIILSGADSAESDLVNKAKAWFEENRENETAIMSGLIFMVSGSNMV